VWPFRKKVAPWIATLHMGTRQEIGSNRALNVRVDIVRPKKDAGAQSTAERAQKFFNSVNSGGFQTQAYISSVTPKQIVLWLACLFDEDVPRNSAWDLLDKVLQEAVMQFNNRASENTKLS
jgi:hypothetical protein